MHEKGQNSTLEATAHPDRNMCLSGSDVANVTSLNADFTPRCNQNNKQEIMKRVIERESETEELAISEIPEIRSIKVVNSDCKELMLKIKSKMNRLKFKKIEENKNR